MAAEVIFERGEFEAAHGMSNRSCNPARLRGGTSDFEGRVKADNLGHFDSAFVRRSIFITMLPSALFKSAT